jgi:hypothetical protein
MNAQKALVCLLAAVGLITACASSSAQPMVGNPASSATVQRDQMVVVYVGDFTPTLPTADSESGLFRRMKAEHDEKKINANAQSLSDAVVAAFRSKGVVAYRVSASQPPVSGWLIDGSYQQTISHNPFPILTSLVQPSQPNTDASIHITDLTAEHAGTLASFTSAATLKGQGSSFSTNPYKIAAHIVVHHIEASSSMNTLANAIADRIVAINDASSAPSSNYTVARLP